MFKVITSFMYMVAYLDISIHTYRIIMSYELYMTARFAKISKSRIIILDF